MIETKFTPVAGLIAEQKEALRELHSDLYDSEMDDDTIRLFGTAFINYGKNLCDRFYITVTNLENRNIDVMKAYDPEEDTELNELMVVYSEILNFKKILDFVPGIK